MNLELSEGTYVLAVSGGVDSMVLLYMAKKLSLTTDGYEFVVAHFNHGIREEAEADAFFVQKAAENAGFRFFSGTARLGKGASEDIARQARYTFLRTISQTVSAKGIVTAHHQDDVVETMLLHVARGTGRKGLTPMIASADIVRPLLFYKKTDVVSYAKMHSIEWREDATNLETNYKRNKFRHALQQSGNEHIGEGFVRINNSMLQTNKELERVLREVMEYVLTPEGELLRSRFVLLPHQVANTCMYEWLHMKGVRGTARQKTEQLVIAAKTLAIGKKINIKHAYWLVSAKNKLRIYKND